MSFSKPSASMAALVLAALPLLAAAPASAQEALPSQVAGTWRITRALPTKNTGCWEAAGSLVGSTLTYRASTMRWRGGEVPVHGIVTRTITSQEFEQEAASTWGTSLKLADLNIQAPRILEVDLQHEDADITGSTTEVPGDSILLAGRNTIVVSACGSFFEAARLSPAAPHAAPQSTGAENRLGTAVKSSQNRMNTSFQGR